MRSSVTVGEVLADKLNIKIEDWSQSAMNRVARCLKSFGWVRRQIRTEGTGREWQYRRPDLSPDDL
jgi:hypothetical protein